MLGYFFLMLLIYIIFRFVVGFVIPLLQATSRMKQQMRNMNGNNSGRATANTDAGQANSTSTQNNRSTTSKPGNKDYIEFEEIK